MVLVSSELCRGAGSGIPCKQGRAALLLVRRRLLHASRPITELGDGKQQLVAGYGYSYNYGMHLHTCGELNGMRNSNLSISPTLPLPLTSIRVASSMGPQ